MKCRFLNIGSAVGPTCSRNDSLLASAESRARIAPWSSRKQPPGAIVPHHHGAGPCLPRARQSQSTVTQAVQGTYHLNNPPRLDAFLAGTVDAVCVGRVVTALIHSALCYRLPYGLEDIIHGAGYPGAIVVLLVVPLIWSLPTALMVSELASSLPKEGGYYIWVRRALGPFWGFQEAWLSLTSSVFDMAIYPILFVSYLGFAGHCAADGAGLSRKRWMGLLLSEPAPRAGGPLPAAAARDHRRRHLPAAAERGGRGKPVSGAVSDGGGPGHGVPARIERQAGGEADRGRPGRTGPGYRTGRRGHTAADGRGHADALSAVVDRGFAPTGAARTGNAGDAIYTAAGKTLTNYSEIAVGAGEFPQPPRHRRQAPRN